MVSAVDTNGISIHAPLAGRDFDDRDGKVVYNHFNPRAPCGARQKQFEQLFKAYTFQSTRPLRGATLSTCPGSRCRLDFNPRAPCGARLCLLRLTCDVVDISIHAPLAGRDAESGLNIALIDYFNPRAPCGARRGADKRGDADSNFNPRAPCGARLQTCGHRAACALISIHAPLAGRDLHRLLDCLGHTYFNPRAPCGARHTRFKWGAFSFNFNPRAPCGARLLHNPRCAS